MMRLFVWPSKTPLAGVALASLLVVSASAPRAERMPDPDEFLAGLVAFSELCAARSPRMQDATSKMWQATEKDCKAHGPAGSGPPTCEGIRAQKEALPKFQSALAIARQQVRAMPAERVATECDAMYSSFK